jgi:hypothetical protein
VSFLELTRINPGKRRDIAKAMYDTGLRACASEYLGRNAGNFALDGNPLFQSGPTGWDVAPASAEMDQ